MKHLNKNLASSTKSIDRRSFLGFAAAGTLSLLLPQRLLAKTGGPAPILIRGAAIFTGKSPKLITGSDVLVKDGMISAIGPNLSADGAEVIDADGRTLLPGLTDAHTHIVWNDEIEKLIYSAPEGYSGVLGAVNAERMLLRGFTTVRDLGGPVYGLKEAIDAGATPGPRILPSGAFLSQTSGHGDFDSRMFNMSQHYTGQIDKAYLRGWTFTADGVAEVQKASREVLRAGASQIKIMGSGSITGAHDPLDVTEYTFEELRAIVVEAEKWGTYATIHAYTEDSIANAIEAGVKSVEHALFASEELIQMMKDKDVFFSTQFFSYSVTPEQAGLSGETATKYLQAQAGAKNGYENAKKIGVKMAFGTDMLGSLSVAPLQSQEFLARQPYYSNYEILKQATSDNAELFARSGLRHPYRDGPLGVIDVGAYGDLLIANGNPLEDLDLVAKPDTGLALIMKDGKIYKNTI